MRGRPFPILRVAADVTAALVAFAFALQLYATLISSGFLPGRDVPSVRSYVGLAAGHAALLVLVSWRAGLYLPRAGILNLWEIRASLRSSLIAAAFLLSGLFVFKLQTFSRIVVVTALAFAIVCVLLEKRVLAAYLQGRRRRNLERLVIVGAGDTGRLLMKKILTAPHLGYAVLGFLDPVAPIGAQISCITDQGTLSTSTRRVLGRPDDLEALTSQSQIDQLLIDEASLTPNQMTRVRMQAVGLGISFGIVPALAGLRAGDLRLEDLSAIPVLRPHREGPRRAYDIGKRLLDLVVASVLLVVTAPLWLAVAALIRWDSTGPVIFSHTRIGKGGKPFRLLKFRTMAPDSDPYRASPVGDRASNITRVGRLLRATGLDELPQLVNVVRGEMSLVGPRPEMPFIVDGYGPAERVRLRATPGLTGLWQISPDRQAQIHENLEYDLYYIHNKSLLLDLVVLLETLFTTIEISLKKLLPGAREVDHGPSAAELKTVENARQRYVLLAMDQRRSRVVKESWSQGIDVALREAARLPVRVTSTPTNLGDLEQLVRHSNTVRSSPARIRFVEVSGLQDVRPMLEGASAVVTNLEPVADWAREQGTPLVPLSHEQMEHFVSTSQG